MAVVIDQCGKGQLPKGVGRAKRGPHHEPELLSRWAKRNHVPIDQARELLRRHRLPPGIVAGRTGPKLEWFESWPGIRHVLKVQAEHGHAIIRQYKLVQSYQRRVWHWQDRYKKFEKALERHRQNLRKLYAEHWKLRNQIKKAQTAIERGDTYFTSANLDEIKLRLFGPDVVELEAERQRQQHRRRQPRGKYRGKKSVLPGVRQKGAANSGATPLAGDDLHRDGDGGSPPQ